MYQEGEIYFKELAYVIMGQTNQKFVRQAGWLEIEIRVEFAVLSLKSIGQARRLNSGRNSTL